MPDEIDVKADGGLRIITLNRPDELNAVNDALHVGLAKIWEALNEDTDARAAVITGAGRAFSAGGDFNYLDELRNDEALRQKTIKHGRDLVIGMVRCRIPVVAAVNGPAVGLGLQPGGALGHRLHGRDRVLRRPARLDRVWWLRTAGHWCGRRRSVCCRPRSSHSPVCGSRPREHSS